jgi:hypothetical protein
MMLLLLFKGQAAVSHWRPVLLSSWRKGVLAQRTFQCNHRWRHSRQNTYVYSVTVGQDLRSSNDFRPKTKDQ